MMKEMTAAPRTAVQDASALFPELGAAVGAGPLVTAPVSAAPPPAVAAESDPDGELLPLDALDEDVGESAARVTATAPTAALNVCVPVMVTEPETLGPTRTQVAPLESAPHAQLSVTAPAPDSDSYTTASLAPSATVATF